MTKKGGEAHDVGARNVVIHKTGALVFLDGLGYITLAYAAGEWTEVCEAGYE